MASNFQRLRIPRTVTTVSPALFNSLLDTFDNGINGLSFTSPIRYSTAYGVSAHPSGLQPLATRLGAEINNIDIVSVANGSVKLVNALPGYSITVKNNSANNLRVYPYEEDILDDNLKNIPVVLLPEETRIFKSISDSRWESMPNSTITIVSGVTSTPSLYSLLNAAPFAVLTNGTTTISNPKLLIPDGNTGQNTLTPSSGITFIQGSNVGLSTGATANAKTLYDQLVVLTGATHGAVNLETVNVGYGTGRFTPGVYVGSTGIVTAAAQTITLIGDGDYVFVSQGAMTFGATTTIKLTHGAQASRVFWVSVGAITTGAVNVLKGNFMTTAAINIGATNDIEGRLLSTLAANITIDGTATNIYLP